MDPVFDMVVLPLALGLLGFIEPCSIGASLLFLKTVEGKPARQALIQTIWFVLARAGLIGLLGVLAALAGAAFFSVQQTGWALLGGLYLLIGLIHLSGNASFLMRSIGPSLARVSTRRGAAGLGILFGFNIPACAAPLLAGLLGMAALGGAPGAVQGFVTLGLFGLALSLPLVAVLIWPSARTLLNRALAWSHRVPLLIGLIFLALGVWSIYQAVFSPPL